MFSRILLSLLMGLALGATPPVFTAPALSPHHALMAGLGAYHTCLHTANGTTRCWGDNASGQVGPSLPLTVPVRALAAGEMHTCAAPLSGGAWCWGGNLYGQLGDGTHQTSHRPPTPVLSLTVPLSGLVAGTWHTCAATTSGQTWCWGHNSEGQLGVGDNAPRLTPAPVAGLTDTVHLAAGGEHTCALNQAGAVRCWGANGFGQLGVLGEARPNPTLVAGLPGPASALAAGGDHTCAVVSGTAWCWGNNDAGQLGSALTTTAQMTPTAVAGLGQPVVALALGYQHTCALTLTGEVVCWGRNDLGQRGQPGPAGPFTALAAGGHHTCALALTGALWCWGSNTHGQLGWGTASFSALPVPANLPHRFYLPGLMLEQTPPMF